MEGGGVSCLSWGVGIDRWTVFSILRGGGGGGYGIVGYLFIRYVRIFQLPGDAFGESCCRVSFSGKLLSPGDAFVEVLVAG